MANRKRLTNKQKKIVEKRGLFVVKACPGSGKTYAVAARLARLMGAWKDEHRGIATISFTNVAWREIEKYLSEDFGVEIPISYPHFLGTIDSFFNRYMFLPFGHLTMKCSKRPELIGPPVNNWEPIGSKYWWREKECHNRNCRLNEFSYNLNGDLTNVISRRSSVFKNCPLDHERCLKLKQGLIREGYGTQRDANYFAMKILDKYRDISRAIVNRFPMMMMDEAQDTSDIEIRIVEILIENGLKEVMMIGDPEQAIFEWRDAKPEMLEKKYREWKENSLTLNENWRSSQNICNFFHRISSLEKVPTALNSDVKGLEAKPEIWEYNDDKMEEIVEKFIKMCNKWCINSETEDIAILARSRDVVKLIMGGREKNVGVTPWKNDITEAVCESRYLFDRGEFKKAFYTLEKDICKKMLKIDYCSKEDLEKFVEDHGFVIWRKSVYKILESIPKAEGTLGEWITKAREHLDKEGMVKADEIGIKNRGKYARVYPGLRFEDVLHVGDLESSKDERKIGTVHSVKGETFDAVLVILKKTAGDARKYTNMLDEKIINNEELRIVFVAITRPRRLLVIAVPLSEKTAWETKFFG